MEVSLSLIVRTLRPIPLLSRRLVARPAVRHALSERSRSVRSSFVPQKRIPASYFPLTTPHRALPVPRPRAGWRSRIEAEVEIFVPPLFSGDCTAKRMRPSLS